MATFTTPYASTAVVFCAAFLGDNAAWAADAGFANSKAVPWTLTGNANATASSFLGTTSNLPLVLKADGVEGLRILPSGAVGIGTSSPSGLLDVAGLLITTSFSLPTGAISGYVLTSDASGNATWHAGTPGAQGPQGAQGAQGAQGPQGPAGFVTLPYNGSAAVNSAALAVTNTETGYAGFGRAANGIVASSAGDAAFGVQGANSGTNGIGVDGFANGTGGTGVLGLAGGSGGVGVNGTFNGSAVVGSGATFSLNVSSAPNASTFSTNAAVNASSASANGTTYGYYGSAGRFISSNSYNFDPAVYAIGSVAVYGTGIPQQGSVGVEGRAGNGFDSAGFYGLGGFANTKGIYTVGSNQVAGNEAADFKIGSSGTGECYFDGGPGFNCSSDRNLKTGFIPADARALLAKVASMPEWQYRMKDSNNRAWYIGPTAQEFRAAFGLGTNDTTINTANAQGVALTAIKGLNEKLDDAIRAKDAEIAALKQRISSLESLGERVAAIAANGQHPLNATYYQAASAVNP